MVGHSLSFGHDALAALTGEEQMKLTPLEKDVATKSLTWSLELAGLERMAIYLAPALAVFVLFVIEWKRYMLIRAVSAQKAAQREAEEAAARASYQGDFEPEPAAPIPPSSVIPATARGNGVSKIVPQNPGAAIPPRPIAIE
jgi:hypothetical protein